MESLEPKSGPEVSHLLTHQKCWLPWGILVFKMTQRFGILITLCWNMNSQCQGCWSVYYSRALCIHSFIIKSQYINYHVSENTDCLVSQKGILRLPAGLEAIHLFSLLPPVSAALGGSLPPLSWPPGPFFFHFRCLEPSFESVTSCMSREKGDHWEVALNSLPVPDPESFSLTSTESDPANLYVLCLAMGCHVSVCVPWRYL